MGCRILKAMKRHLLLVLTVVGITLGFVLGFAIRETNPSADTLMWIELPGEMFLRLLKMMIVPIIVTNVITGTASLDSKSNGIISGVALAYITATNVLSCILGMVLSLTIKPGSRGMIKNETVTGQMSSVTSVKTQDIFADLIRNIVPSNIISATFSQEITRRQNISGVEQRTTDISYSSNILGLIFASMFFGIATAAAKEKGKVFLDFFQSASTVVIIILRWFLWYSPIGICSLIAASIGAITDLSVIFTSLGLLVLAVTAGLAILQLVLIPLIHFIAARENPYKLLLRMHRAWFITFAASGSAVAIPDIMYALDKHGVDNRITQFAVPFSVTLSANGSGVYIVSAAIFLAQFSGITLNAGQIITIVILTSVSIMALPSVPSSSLVALVTIMTSLGLPIHQLGLLFSVEWFLDRMRSAACSVGHTYGAAFTYSILKNRLKDLPETEMTRTTDIGENADEPKPTGKTESRNHDQTGDGTLLPNPEQAEDRPLISNPDQAENRPLMTKPDKTTVV